MALTRTEGPGALELEPGPEANKEWRRFCVSGAGPGAQDQGARAYAVDTDNRCKIILSIQVHRKHTDAPSLIAFGKVQFNKHDRNVSKIDFDLLYPQLWLSPLILVWNRCSSRVGLKAAETMCP